jgi:hypothetical protein
MSEETIVETTEATTPEQGIVETGEPNGQESNESPDIRTDEENEKKLKGWQEDKRYETFWKKDPNNLYGSYKTLEQKLEENGLKIKEYEEKIDNLNKSNSEVSELTNYFESISKHPAFSNKFNDLINEYNKSIRREAYGADLPDHIVDKLQKVDELEEYVQKQKETEKVTEQSKIIEEQQSKIDEIAKKHNIEYDKNEFLEWCKENRIAPSSMEAHFIKHAYNHIIGAVKHQTQNTVIKNVDLNKKATLPSNTKKGSDGTEASFRQRMLDALS